MAADVRNLQLAKAAVAAGIRVLLQQRGIAPEQVDGVYLAGGFGSYLDPESAMAIGSSRARARARCTRSATRRSPARPRSRSTPRSGSASGLVPGHATIWSCPAAQILPRPLPTICRFRNHNISRRS